MRWGKRVATIALVVVGVAIGLWFDRTQARLLEGTGTVSFGLWRDISLSAVGADYKTSSPRSTSRRCSSTAPPTHRIPANARAPPVALTGHYAADIVDLPQSEMFVPVGFGGCASSINSRGSGKSNGGRCGLIGRHLPVAMSSFVSRGDERRRQQIGGARGDDPVRSHAQRPDSTDGRDNRDNRIRSAGGNASCVTSAYTKRRRSFAYARRFRSTSSLTMSAPM